MKPFACNAPNEVKMQVYHCTPPINRDQFGNWSVHPAFALLCRHRSGFLRKPTRDNLCAQAATALCGPGGMRRTVRCGGQGRAGDQHAVAVIMRSAFLEGVGRHGLVAVWSRSFDSVMCSKGDEPWAQEERMNFAKMRCGSR